MLAQYEAQIGAHFAHFTIPHNYQVQLRTEAAASDPVAENDTAGHRRRLEGQLARLRDLFLIGDLERAAYVADRDRLKRELSTLEAQRPRDDQQLVVLERLLADVARGWDMATQEQRNRLAGLIFEEVVMDSERVVALKPRPELAQFFALACPLLFGK